MRVYISVDMEGVAGIVHAARSLHPVRARELIRDAAKRVVAAPQRFVPYALALPLLLELELMNTAITDAVAIVPGLQRTGPRSVRYECADVDTMFRALMTIVRLGGTVA